jgi:hypothetical protein
MEHFVEIGTPIPRLYQNEQGHSRLWFYGAMALVFFIVCFAVYVHFTSPTFDSDVMTKPVSTSTPIATLLFSKTHTVPASSS